MDARDTLFNWMGRLNLKARWSDAVPCDASPNLHVHLATANNEYAISFSPTYLGCVANSRIVRPGESWQRGNDLPDGPFSEDTWRRIVQAIVEYELVSFPPVEEAQTVEATPVLV